ncbi:MAG: uroporphyrinogen-III synthase [Burkholderiaceae bacterium]
MRVLVTRPALQAAEWVEQLTARGVDAVALPLIGIAAPLDPGAVRAAWADLARQRLVMFVSPNAADRFFAQRPAGVLWPARTLAGSPGPGTSRALVALGVPPTRIVAPAADSSQFDSEALWEQLEPLDWHEASVLLVRGDGGREWLAETLRARGARVDALTTYRRSRPVLGIEEQRLLDTALQHPTSHLWLFSSSQAVVHLGQMAGGGAPEDDDARRWAGAHAIATHPRIAEQARVLGVGHVLESHPTADALVACIQSLRT